MKSSSAHLSVAARVLLVSFGTLVVACKESPRGAQGVDDSDSKGVLDRQEPTTAHERGAAEEGDTSEDPSPPDKEIAELRSKIQSRQQTVGDLQAAVEMERAKLVENPDYDQSFLLGMLDEQQQLQEAIKSGEKRLEQLSGEAD